jgi:hypothetical protein
VSDNPNSPSRQNAPREAIDTVRRDPELGRQLYQAGMGIVFSVVGIFVAYNPHYARVLSISIGGLVALVGVVLAILVILRGISMRRGGRFPNVALASILLVVGVPLIIWGIVGLTYK